jgi:D-alanyl-lipoteichoic acid acyltransferase DltB (MBOAT superfamily)
LTQGLAPAVAADARLGQRLSFDFYFAFFLIIALHGFGAIKVLTILYINYKIAKTLPREKIPAVTWIFNIGILFANEFGKGYPYQAISLQLTLGHYPGPGIWLDKHAGLIPRWEVLFNICILRLISFNMDYYWSAASRTSGGSSPVEVSVYKLNRNSTYEQKKKQLDPANLSVRDRVNNPAKSDDFSFRNYIAYILYGPLYLTGPIITFNDFISQQRYKSATITFRRTLMYGIRFVVVLFAMEVMIHLIYAVAISKADPDWSVYTPFQLSMLGYFNLHHIWLKLLIPWRFFRLWALIDGIDPPENMARCMSNNYSALAFWRGWHRSYNRWIVRYVYIPLGGSAQPGVWGTIRTVGNFGLVFMFVALWHDINLRLLMWGWLITLFVLPEIVATLLFPARNWKDRPNTYRVICGVGAVGNILMMMIANLVGYAIGIDGLKGLIHGIIGSTAGLAFLAAACGCLFIGAQLMFEERENEKRQGIQMPC